MAYGELTPAGRSEVRPQQGIPEGLLYPAVLVPPGPCGRCRLVGAERAHRLRDAPLARFLLALFRAVRDGALTEIAAPLVDPDKLYG